MFHIERYDFEWWKKRFMAILVGFPENLTPDLLKKEKLCSEYDVDEAYRSLKSAHEFLTGIAKEIDNISNTDENKYNLFDRLFLKFQLIWALCLLGELQLDNNEYVLSFDKKTLNTTKKGTFPSSFSSAFDAVFDNGCYGEYYKNNNQVTNFKSCDRGILHFDSNILGLGLWLYVNKCIEKRWYWEDDKSGNYSAREFDPMVHCIEPYHRIDFRVFTCGERLKYDLLEQLNGYSNTIINIYKEIKNHVDINYPVYQINQGFYRCILCTMSFSRGNDKRLLGSFGVGASENKIGFFSCLSGKEMQLFLDNVDFWGKKVISSKLYPLDCDRSKLKNEIEIVYRGNMYLFDDKTGIEIRFPITCEEDVEQAKKIFDIKAKCELGESNRSR